MPERYVSLFSLAKDLGEHVDVLERIAGLARIKVVRRHLGQRMVRSILDRDVPALSEMLEYWRNRPRLWASKTRKRMPKRPAR